MAKVRDPKIAGIIANNIRRIRILRGMTQKDLQEKVGWRYQAMVSQLECGRAGVGPQTLRKLAEALNVSPSDLYSEHWTPLTETTQVETLPVVKLSTLHKDTIEPNDIIGYFPLPPKTFGDNSLNIRDIEVGNNIVCAMIEDESMNPEFFNGDIIGIEMDRTSMQSGKRHVIRFEKSVEICDVEIRGSIVALHSLSRKKKESVVFDINAPVNTNEFVEELHRTSREPILVDLRAHPSSVVGPVVWLFRLQ